MAANNGRTRVSLDFTQPALMKLEALRLKTGAKDNSGVIRNALMIYSTLVDASDLTLILEIDGDEVTMTLVPELSPGYRKLKEVTAESDRTKTAKFRLYDSGKNASE